MVDLTNGKITEKVVMPGGCATVNGGFGRVTSADGSSSYDYYQSPDFTLGIWRQDAERAEVQQISCPCISLKNTDLGAALGVEWEMSDGKKLAGKVLLPPGYQTGTRIPIVVEGYPDCSMSRMLDRGPGRAGLFIDPYVMAAHGYAMFYPDLTLDEEHIRVQIGAMIDSGVDRLVELGIADPDRLAIVGQSYGGYAALCAISHTKRFKAAIVSGAIADFPRMYGSMNEHGLAFGVGYCECGQAGLGGSVWDKMDRYFEESPFYHLDKARTATLLIAGAQDFVGNDQSKAVFVGLRRLGIPVELRLYDGEQHAPMQWTSEAKLDFYEQVFAWLDRWVL